MEASQEIEFFDSNPNQFFDYNPQDLMRMEVAGDFSSVDPNALVKKQEKLNRGKAIHDYMYAPEKTPEEIKKMGFFEKMEYAKQLEKEFTYRQSKGATKGAASGATFGLSEYVPGLEPEEDDMLFGFGELVGSALPISKLYNLLGKPLVKLAAKSPYARKALESLARMTGFGLTGGTYESAKHVVKEQEAPSVEDVLKWGGQWALLDGALQVAGKAINWGNKLRLAAKNNKNLNTQKVTNDIISQLAEEKINPELNPEEYATRAEELLDEYLPKEQIEAKPEVADLIEKVKEPEKPIAPEVSEPSKEAKVEVKPDKLEIKKKPKPVKQEKKPPEIPEPIIETTGEGAEKRHEYAKTSTQNVIEAVNNFIRVAKNPAQSFKRSAEAMNTAVFNFLAPLENLEQGVPIADRVTSKIKLAQSAASEINSVLDNGIFSNMTGNFEHGGLKEAYGDLTWKTFTKNLKPGEYSLEELNTYRTSKIALKRQAEGKKTGVDTEIAKQDIASLKDKYEAIDSNIREFQKATISNYGKDLLGEDLIKLFNDNYYSPLYRVMDSGKDSILAQGSLTPRQPFFKIEGSTRKIIPPSESDPYNAAMLIRNARKNDAVLAYMEKVQKGELPGKIRKGKQNKIPEHIRDDIGIDEDLDEVADNLYAQTRKEAFTPEQNILRCWKDGKPIDIEVPEDIYNVFKTASPQQLGPFSKFFSSVNRVFSRGISLEPRKFGSIFGRDALSSLVYSKTGSNPASIFEALGDIFGDREVYKQFKAMGGDVYAAKLATRIERTNKVNDLISAGKQGIMIPFDKAFGFFKKYADTIGDISMAVPLAEYKRALEVFGNTTEGRIAAAMEARRVTYDPTRKGGSKIMQGVGNFVPFWNVSFQDASMVAENLQNKSTWMKGALIISAPTLALKFYNDGNPDYEALTPLDKAAFWHLFSPLGHARIPIPWLLGTVFKVGAEFFYDTVKSQAEEGNQRAKEAWQGLYENTVSNISGSLPPILQNYIEMTTGKSPASPLGQLLGVESKAPDVVPKRLQGLPPELQYTSKTSQLARWFGAHWGVSPVKLERSIKSYGGLLAADLFALTDEIAYFSGLADDKRPEKREKNYLLLGHFVSENTPSRTKYQVEFYNMLDEKTKQTRAKKIIPGYGDKALDAVDLGQYNRDISARFKEMRRIEDDVNMSASEKKRKLEHQQIEINRLYKQAVDKVRSHRSS